MTHETDSMSPALTPTVDPICGMTVDPTTAAHHVDHHGERIFFCSARCRTTFLAEIDADRKAERPVPDAAPGMIWTCPMHPDIRRPEPGPCPICGMALEPEAPSLDDRPNPELVDFTRRFGIAALLAAPLLLISMAIDMLGLAYIDPGASRWIQLLLTTPIVLWAGAPFFVRGWTSIVTRRPNMFTLIALGVGAAYVYSVAATLAPGLIPSGTHAHRGHVPVYFEAAGVVVALVLLGQVLELRARAATGRAIRALLDLAPKQAWRIAPDGS